ncbi:LysR family transcriptional regulator [Streptomyces triculaminicus]|uniref:LysR family transcriptional regulator n=1 Tax=Streptomyces triculaminicus TaxID=2816232 RepID=UPI0037D22587
MSFTRAAAELSYAQSSVTGQIKALESSLQTQLFDRLGGRSSSRTRVSGCCRTRSRSWPWPKRLAPTWRGCANRRARW